MMGLPVDLPAPAILGALIIAGLAGSLHCVGMCGPILAAFTVAAAPNQAQGGASRSLWLDLAAYHLGRIWTYGVLGLLAGVAGSELREATLRLGWQRPLALVFSMLWIGAGVSLLGFGSAGSSRLAHQLSPWRWHWFKTLVHEPTFGARFLLGTVLGLLPCGLVYGALVLGATTGSPVWSAAGMIAFGLGTLPALTALLVLGRRIPIALRNRGSQWVAASLILAGCVMAARAVLFSSHTM